MVVEKKVDYEAVLADLEAQKAKIDNAIVVIRQMLGKGKTPSIQESNAPAGDRQTASLPISSDTFFSLSIIDASKKFLSIVKRPQSTREIADALEGGGITHRSKNFYGTLFSMLRRAHRTGEGVVKVKNKWGLSEWYGKKG